MMPSLPHALTRLIGREAEVAALSGLLCNRESRLLTLTGAAGVGKSRLAIEALARASAVIPNEVGFIDLTTTENPLLFLYAISGALGMQLTAPTRRSTTCSAPCGIALSCCFWMASTG